MALVSNKVARRIWYSLCGFFMIETAGMFTIAPYWNGGAIEGDINALACLMAGGGVTCFLLASSEPGAAFLTRSSRYMFAFIAGLATNVISTWALWAIGYPIINGTIKRGLMAANYWLGPVILAYAVILWLVYRKGLEKEAKLV